MGSLFTSSNGAEITGIGNGAVELDLWQALLHFQTEQSQT